MKRFIIQGKQQVVSTIKLYTSLSIMSIFYVILFIFCALCTHSFHFTLLNRFIFILVCYNFSIFSLKIYTFMHYFLVLFTLIFKLFLKRFIVKNERLSTEVSRFYFIFTNHTVWLHFYKEFLLSPLP